MKFPVDGYLSVQTLGLKQFTTKFIITFTDEKTNEEITLFEDEIPKLGRVNIYGLTLAEDDILELKP